MQTKTIRIAEWLSSVRVVPQHSPVSAQCPLMTSTQEKLICRPWEGPSLDTGSAEVKHIRLLTRHCFSQGKKMKPSLTDTSRQNYKLSTFFRNVFHLSRAFFSSPSQRPPLPLWDANNNTQGQIPDFKAWNYNCETVTISVTQPLTHSHCVEKSIKPGRNVFRRHMALLKSWQTGGCFQSQLQWDGELLL